MTKIKKKNKKNKIKSLTPSNTSKPTNNLNSKVKQNIDKAKKIKKRYCDCGLELGILEHDEKECFRCQFKRLKSR